EAVKFEGPQTTGELVPGNTPVWDQFLDTRREGLARSDLTQANEQPGSLQQDPTLPPEQRDEGPPPRPEPLELEERRLKDVTVLPERPAETPEQQLAAIEGLREQAVIPLDA